MKTTTHFITGATGFVGSYVLIELLKQTKDTIYCLVRPKKGKMPKERIIGLLDELIPAYQECVSLKIAARNRIVIVTGDLSSDLPTLKEQLPEPITYFWHVAASLNYEERFAEQIFATNVQGTLQAMQIAEMSQTEYFNHFSTAYVVGRREGIMSEEPILETDSNNAYERSKVEAENRVLANTTLKTRIFRPSIVIGHSQTKHAFNFSGMYGFLRKLSQFKGITNRIQKGYLDRNPVKMKFHPSVPLNLVPVDKVAQEAVQIGITDAPQRIFNLTNPEVLSVGETLDLFFQLQDLSAPVPANSTESFNWIDQKFNEKIEFYNSYLVGHKIFDRTNTNTALNDFEIDRNHAITKSNLEEHSLWYLKQLDQQRKALPASR